jgi:hypothetical protein
MTMEKTHKKRIKNAQKTHKKRTKNIKRRKEYHY